MQAHNYWLSIVLNPSQKMLERQVYWSNLEVLCNEAYKWNESSNNRNVENVNSGNFFGVFLIIQQQNYFTYIVAPSPS